MATESTEKAQELNTTTEVGLEGNHSTAETENTAAETVSAAEVTSAATENDTLPLEEEKQDSSSKSVQENAAATAENENAEVDTPDDIDPFIAKVCETIQHEVEDEELDKFLRAHIKPFREEWDTWRAEAKDAYLHMMASQLVQRKAAKTRIMIYEKFKLPVPSAQTKLFESLKQSQVKPKRCIPVLLLPPNLRPTYSLKK